MCQVKCFFSKRLFLTVDWLINVIIAVHEILRNYTILTLEGVNHFVFLYFVVVLGVGYYWGSIFPVSKQEVLSSNKATDCQTGVQTRNNKK